MAVKLIGGPRVWDGERDDDGHRTYKISHLIKGAIGKGTADGPANVLQTPGLPQPGDPWLVDGDVDIWAWCRPTATMRPVQAQEEGHPFRYWSVEQEFSTRPPDVERCHDARIEDPLLEPQRVSGTFAKYTAEATHAKRIVYKRDGVELRIVDGPKAPILSSSHEQLRGAQVEFDKTRSSIRIEQNVAVLDWGLVASMIDTLNDRDLWGFPKRKIKLTDASFDIRYHGLCYKYYTRTFDFDIDYDTWDRSVLDEGTRVLFGDWGDPTKGTPAEQPCWLLRDIEGYIGSPNPNPLDPSHFIVFKDRTGNAMRAVLNGRGEPIPGAIDFGGGADEFGKTTGTATGSFAPCPDESAGEILIEKFAEANFLLLGIPTVL